MPLIKKFKLFIISLFVLVGFSDLSLSNSAGPKGGLMHGMTNGIASGAGISFAASVAGVGSNVIMGAEFAAKCAGQQYWACPFAAAMLAQAGEDSSGASNANQVHMDATNFDSSLFNNQVNDALSRIGDEVGAENGSQYSAQDGQLTRLDDWARQQLGDLEKKGVKLNDDGTVTTPKGTFKTGGLGSGAGMAAAGMIDETEIVMVDEAIKKAQGKGLKHGNILLAAGGGGYSGGARRGIASTSDANGFKMNFNMGKRGKTKLGTAGLTRRIAGEPIGAKTGNLFDMVHKTYQRKANAQEFVK